MSALARQFKALMLDFTLHCILESDPSADGTEDSPEAPARYAERNQWVYQAVSAALGLGYRAGIRVDPEQPDWPVAYIDLPTGQVSWHLPAYPGQWDGHDNPTKAERIRAWSDTSDQSDGWHDPTVECGSPFQGHLHHHST